MKKDFDKWKIINNKDNFKICLNWVTIYNQIKP